MKRQILFSGENEKNIRNLSSTDLALSLVKANTVCNNSFVISHLSLTLDIPIIT